MTTRPSVVSKEAAVHRTPDFRNALTLGSARKKVAMNEALCELRPRMMSVAYRILGSFVDAEDAVQEAFLRLQSTDDVTSPEAFLVRTTACRCIDRMRAQRRRDHLRGRWISEPADTNGVFQVEALVDPLRQAFLLTLERLTQIEMATYVLRIVFDYEYAEIADVLDKTEGHVRQIHCRANSRLFDSRPRFEPAFNKTDELAERFVSACRLGDIHSIEQIFAEDACSAGGGQPSAARAVTRHGNRAGGFVAGVLSAQMRV